jgi:hypothetical protein
VRVRAAIAADFRATPVAYFARIGCAMRTTPLDAQWQDLMSLCGREKQFRSEQRHPKLLRLVSAQIDEIAARMGFSARQIQSREFRAERVGDHITRVIVE